jgi:flagellar hook-basal body complex protein FliE
VTVEPIVPDAPPPEGREAGDAVAFARALDGVTATLLDANRAEDAFAAGAGTLRDAVYERARADVALSVAAATAQRLAQALQTVLNMQV